jgi:hypothetical protein
VRNIKGIIGTEAYQRSSNVNGFDPEKQGRRLGYTEHGIGFWNSTENVSQDPEHEVSQAGVSCAGILLLILTFAAFKLCFKQTRGIK